MNDAPSSREKARCLVSGATGFLGHHLCAELLRAGYPVRALVRDPNTEAAQRLPEAVERVPGDLLNPDTLPGALAEVAYVLHCAGKVSRDPDDATALHRANVLATENLLAAAKAAGVRRFVHASTSGTIGVSRDEDHIATEEDEPPLALINRWPYYRTKLYAEQLALAADGGAFEVVVVNPSLLLGPGDLHGSSTEDVRRLLEERVPVAPAGGYSYVDARDAASGMRLALERGGRGERYLLTASNCTLRTFFNRVASVAGMDPPVLTLPKHARVKSLTLALSRAAHRVLGEDESVPDPVSIDLAQHYWYVDASKAERELGWRSRDAMQTIADTVEDLRARGLVMLARPV